MVKWMFDSSVLMIGKKLIFKANRCNWCRNWGSFTLSERESEIFSLSLSRLSVSIKWVFYYSFWKQCRFCFRFCTNINEPLCGRMYFLYPSLLCRSWVPVSQVYLLSKEPPVPVKNKKWGFDESMEELQIHISRLVLRIAICKCLTGNVWSYPDLLQLYMKWF